MYFLRKTISLTNCRASGCGLLEMSAEFVRRTTREPLAGVSTTLLAGITATVLSPLSPPRSGGGWRVRYRRRSPSG